MPPFPGTPARTFCSNKKPPTQNPGYFRFKLAGTSFPTTSPFFRGCIYKLSNYSKFVNRQFCINLRLDCNHLQIEFSILVCSNNVMESIDPNTAYNTKQARRLLQLGEFAFAALIKKNLLNPSRIDKKSHRFLGSEILACMERVQKIDPRK